ncbi:hypothetical protein H5410_012914 [Solanum commersonii]|uniref:DUF1985 domain-containing protein n=1 Tax=Solanum commersonii TaxID=4109 RepID=A0A9J6AT09_SOLCO|nr:hypothetical protein H5410_012914 [Solanum commersonii]
MVYELLKRRFIFQNPEKNDEVLINYCGMPFFFGRREFAIVSGLKCHPPSEQVPEFIVKKEPRRRKKGGKEETRQSTEEQDLMSLVGTSFKNPNLIYLLNADDTPRKHKESLCLLWFVHNVLLAKDLNNNISLKWVNLSRDIEAFKNYPWGHESFELTVKYLLKPLGPKINNLFDFPWDFMVVHPWLVPTEKELQMSYLITLGLVETLFNPVVDRVKMELGVKVIPSKNVRHPYTPQAKRRKKSFIKAIQNLKKKIFRELPMAVGEEALEFKHVNAYNRVTIAEKNKLVDLDHEKYGHLMGRLGNVSLLYVDEILSLMRERHVRYPEYYDSTDRILDLNFYSNFKLRYNEMSEEATTIGGRRFTHLINEFEWDEDMINYVRGIKPYPGDMDWIDAKRILLHEGHMNVYDCLLMGMEHAKFLTFIQPVFELLPKLLKQNGIMKHLPDKFLNEPWEFKGRLEPMVTNDSKATCASYLLAFMKHLITRTIIQPPKTLLCDNAVHRMQCVWATGIVSRSLEP